MILHAAILYEKFLAHRCAGMYERRNNRAAPVISLSAYAHCGMLQNKPALSLVHLPQFYFARRRLLQPADHSLSASTPAQCHYLITNSEAQGFVDRLSQTGR